MDIQKLQRENEVLRANFELEKGLKNQAYYFILENGYFNGFKEYTQKNPTGQNHTKKIKKIAENINN